LRLPAFLFNIGQCHRKLGQHEQAIFFYSRYLKANPASWPCNCASRVKKP
jgi:tetratricopeptide (TPR) repeat protein